MFVFSQNRVLASVNPNSSSFTGLIDPYKSVQQCSFFFSVNFIYNSSESHLANQKKVQTNIRKCPSENFDPGRANVEKAGIIAACRPSALL
ncbi:hypothetical protein AX774_g4326 [Zancudomyces culisetae]|uniref:Uncharacterized protein n=1 Tax=Zancudomyces culisetae TaxID=1213189 RepID=A0A1R1PMM4_ZANCU|nr:hypothetical protein AX774_g4326 [Zancudomyces culisetae]|eukprot:OMH82207.1 hypothetical protein AX774_g4326 [Zancudomyces culisetae]